MTARAWRRSSRWKTAALSISPGPECGAIGASSRRAPKKSAPRTIRISSTITCRSRRSRISEIPLVMAEQHMLQTTIAGSLPKPSWLAEPEKLWAPWRLEGEALAAGKRDATLIWLKEQEDAGIDIVTDGEQSRIHFVHGFLERIDGIDWGRKTKMGIRNNRYEVEVPTVTGPLRRRGPAHGDEARFSRSRTRRKLKIELPGPMTICD